MNVETLHCNVSTRVSGKVLRGHWESASREGKLGEKTTNTIDEKSEIASRLP
jgi:hypothetical protein